MDRILPARPVHPEAERFGQHPSHGGHRPTHRRFESNTEPCTVPLVKAAWLQVGTLAGPRDPDTFLFPRFAEGRGACSLMKCWRRLLARGDAFRSDGASRDTRLTRSCEWGKPSAPSMHEET